jgi:hypothetical protein
MNPTGLTGMHWVGEGRGERKEGSGERENSRERTVGREAKESGEGGRGA